MVIGVLAATGMAGEVAAIIRSGPRRTDTDSRPLLEVFRHLPITQSLRCVSIFELEPNTFSLIQTIGYFGKAIKVTRQRVSEASGRLDWNGH